jgi:hypothetical protein
VRDNGLPAKAWTHVADLDPWMTDAALAALRRAGVAAYSTPHPGRTGAYLDVQLPARPTDRLYVEIGAQERAVVVLAELDPAEPAMGQTALPGGTSAEVDAAFAAIVASFEESPTENDTGAGTSEPNRDPAPPSTGGRRVLRDPVGWDDLFFDDHLRPQQPAEETEEKFVPPPPPPVPHGTPLRRFAWAGVLGAPLIVVLCVLFSYRLDGWIGLLVVGAFVAGLGTLFATLPERGDDTDDGAVV